MIRTWIVRRNLARVYRRLGEGDARPAVNAFASDARFRFPGEHSWALDTTDRDARRAWFERFSAVSPQVTIDDVLVAGPPWRMRLSVVFADEFRDASGSVVYRNRGVQYLHLRWLRITLDEVALDTQQVAKLDQLSDV